MRGNFWYERLELDKALRDYDEALRLDPRLGTARLRRAIAMNDRMEWQMADADLAELLRAEPRNSYAHYQMAVVRFATRRGGAADEARSVVDIQGWREDLSIYAALLGYFALLQDGADKQARGLLDASSANGDPASWPYPIIRHLRRQLDEDGLLAAADNNGRHTVARFFLGLEALEGGDDDAAIGHFRWVKDHGTRRLPQYVMSVAELDRLLPRGAEGDGP